MFRRPVEVLLRPHGTGDLPWAVILQGRRVPIDSLGRSWQDEHGEHYLVLLEGRVWELVHDVQGSSWYLDPVPGEKDLA